jgi:hypothetical protein
MLSRNSVPSPMTRAIVGHHRRDMFHHLPTPTSSERLTGEEKILTRRFLFLLATGLEATRAGTMGVRAVLDLTALLVIVLPRTMGSRVRVDMGTATHPKSKLQMAERSPSNTTPAPIKGGTGGNEQELFDLSYVMAVMMKDRRLAAPSRPTPRRGQGPTDCYAPTTT